MTPCTILFIYLINYLFNYFCVYGGFMKYNVISLSKFLARFGSLKGESLNHITHDEVKILFPQFKRTTFEFARTNKELVSTGKILMVDDGNKIIPYFLPKLDMENTFLLDVLREEDEIREIDYGNYDYASMSIYELKKLLDKKFNSNSNSRCAKKELENRGVIKKKYDRKKFKKELTEELK